MFNFDNQLFILTNVFDDYYKDGKKYDYSQGGKYVVCAPGIKEATIRIPGSLLLEKPKSKTFQAVVFKDLDMNIYAKDSEIKATGTASDVLVVCDDILGLVSANVKTEKTHNLKLKATSEE